MKSSKWILGLMAAVLIMASASSSFAQVQIIISNTPSAGEIQTNRNAQTSDPTSLGSGITITGQLLANSPLTTTTLTLSFGAPITSSALVEVGGGVPSTDPIRVEGGTGVFASVSAISTVNYSTGTVSIILPCAQGAPSPVAGACGGANNTFSGSFRLVGVRNDVNGRTAPLSVTASLSSSANNYIPPTSPTVQTISSLGTWGTPSQGVGGGSQTNNGTFLMFTNQTGGSPADDNATIRIDEGFASAWRTATQSSTNGSTLSNGTRIRMTVTGLPSGVTLAVTSGSTSTPGNRPTIALSPCCAVSATTTSAPTANQIVISFPGTGTVPNLTALDTITLQLTLSGTPSGTLTPGSITATFDIDPIGAAFTTVAAGGQPIGVPTAINGYPVFATDPKGPITIGTIAAANTNLLLPYAVRISSLNFETGIALANTTADPFGGTALGGATATAGTVTVTLFPSTATGAGTASTYTSSTSTRVGTGMATDGTIPAGAVWAVNLTDILSRATPAVTGDFSGYIFLQTNFLNAHGVAYVYDGRGFTSNSPLLVLPPPVTSPRSGGFESLNN